MPIVSLYPVYAGSWSSGDGTVDNADNAKTIDGSEATVTDGWECGDAGIAVGSFPISAIPTNAVINSIKVNFRYRDQGNWIDFFVCNGFVGINGALFSGSLPSHPNSYVSTASQLSTAPITRATIPNLYVLVRHYYYVGYMRQMYVDCIWLDVDYTLPNSAPTTPPSLTVPVIITRGGKPTISWGASTDTNGNLSGYKLERQYNAGSWTQIYTGSALSFVDSIGVTCASVAYRTKAYDSLGAESAYRTSSTITVQGGVELNPDGLGIHYAYKVQKNISGVIKTGKIQMNVNGVIKTILQ